MRVLSVASELFPLIKTGGLADVAGALPGALAPLGVEMRTLVPGYPAVLAGLEGDGDGASTSPRPWAGRRGCWPAAAAGARPPGPRRAAPLRPPGQPLSRPGRRATGRTTTAASACSARVAADIGLGRLGDWRPDLVHGHDWQAGLAPAYLAFAGEPRPATVLTIHNLAFQGLFDPACIGELGLPPRGVPRRRATNPGAASASSRPACFYADRLTTVSPTYAQEIQTEAEGMGLHGLLRSRADDLVGIANGIDDDGLGPGDRPQPAARATTPGASKARPPTRRRCRSASASTPTPTRCCASWSAA